MFLAIKQFAASLLIAIMGLFSWSQPAPQSPPLALTPPKAESQKIQPPPQPASPPTEPQSIPPGSRTTVLLKPAPLPPSPKTFPEKPASLSLKELKACLAKPSPQNADCLDQQFRAFLKDHTTEDALALLKSFEAADPQYRLSCHPVIHGLGRETFRKTGTVHDSFAACDQTCHSGCYHGAMERFLRGESSLTDPSKHLTETELIKKTAGACDANQPTRFRFQCLHGLGHALVYFLDYNMEESLATCDVLPTSWDRSSCYGGAFMENVFAADSAKRDLSPTDYHYPCSKLDDKYRPDCYVMQTTRMSEMGLSTELLFEECRKAAPYQHSCIQSLGRDLSNDARISDPRPSAERCELGQDAEEQHACIRGVIYALIDNTWDGSWAFPFCSRFGAQENISYCFRAAADYLGTTYAKNAQTISQECNAYLDTANAPLCVQQVR